MWYINQLFETFTEALFVTTEDIFESAINTSEFKTIETNEWFS